MRSGVLALVVGVFGCGRIAFDEPAPDPDAPSPIDDTDSDGFTDAADNCPAIATADQDNEDRDDFGDACDPCPPYVDSIPIDDPDGDQLSGLCDPRPGLAGDQRIAFAGFERAPAGATTIGTWAFANGQAIVTNAQGEVGTIAWLSSGAPAETVITHGTIDALTGTNNARGFGIVMQTDLPDDGVVCVLGIRDDNTPGLLLVENDTAIVFVLRPYPVMVGTTATLTSLRSGTHYDCYESSPAASGNTDHAGAIPKLGIHARSTSGRFDWVLVIASPA